MRYGFAAGFRVLMLPLKSRQGSIGTFASYAYSNDNNLILTNSEARVCLLMCSQIWLRYL